MQGGYQQVPQRGGFNKDALLGGLEQGGKRFGGVWKLAFFLCAACTLASGVLAIIIGVANMISPFDFINYVFLALFGLIMLMIDFPMENQAVFNFKMAIFHYAKFMTRFVGRGMWYLFLSAMVVGALWDNDLCPFLGFFLNKKHH